MYADDMEIFAESPEGLQKMLNTLHSYTEEWSLSVNIPKTKVVVFRNGGKLTMLTWKLLMNSNI
jgi:hypothetical protein